MTGLLHEIRRGWRSWRESAALARRPIPEALWRRTLKRFPFLPHVDTQAGQNLLRMTRLFLDRKEFCGVHGLTISDDIAVAIAAQACLPVLELGLEQYDGFIGIVVQPGQSLARRQSMDEHGLVHEGEEVLSGEAVAGGPVMLSWRDVRSAGAKAALGYNVVIHEFAHVLDMADGRPDGTPILPADISVTQWRRTFEAAYEAFQAAVDAGEPTTVDPYGAESLDEFFAVASEAFFVAPQGLHAEQPAVYDLLRGYFRQDPLDRLQEHPAGDRASTAPEP